jgi:molybdopterin/thiamine biosynthesis adenylyltransferase
MFLRKQDIGQPRAQLCAQRLNALNLSHVDIRVIPKSLKDAINEANVHVIFNLSLFLK